MRDGVDVLEFDHLVGEQAQAPALLARGRSRAGQGDEVRFLGAIEVPLALGRGGVAMERGVEAMLDQAFAHASNRGERDIQGVSDSLIRPGGPEGLWSALRRMR